MAYCPKCDANFSIVTSTEGSRYSTPVTTNRYNKENEYIGYEETEVSDVTIETHPRCSNCYSVFQFPHATSKTEYQQLVNERGLKFLRSKLNSVQKPYRHSIIKFGIITILLFGVVGGCTMAQIIAPAISKSKPVQGEAFLGMWVLAIFIAITVVVIQKRANNKAYNVALNRSQDEINRINDEINRISSM